MKLDILTKLLHDLLAFSNQPTMQDLTQPEYKNRQGQFTVVTEEGIYTVTIEQEK